MTSHLAVDLGASSGRVSVVDVTDERVQVTEVHRFRHRPVRWPDGWHWNLPEIASETVTGIRAGLRADPRVASVGVDAWGVDYGLLDSNGSLLGLPFTHRDPRTRGLSLAMAEDELYRRTGVLTQEINTSLQLRAEPRPGRVDVASTLLFVPDLVGYLLTGQAVTERSIASTSQLLGTDGRPDADILAALQLPDLLPQVAAAGSAIGELDPDLLGDRTEPLPLRAVAAHDTASAAAALPGCGHTGFISCGTWGIAGVMSDRPVLTDAARLAGFTNEQAADGRFLLVRNLTGLWLLTETLRGWGVSPSTVNVSDAVAEAATRPAFQHVIDVADPRFTTPGAMAERVIQACIESGQGEPADRPALLRCILDSIATALAGAVTDAAEIAGQVQDRIQLVGGGSQIPLLAQSVADRTGLEVLAGPAEATTIGNALLQASQGSTASPAHAAAALGEVPSFEPNTHARAATRTAIPQPWRD